MPGDDDGLTPDAAPTEHDVHTRIQDKKRWSDDTEVEGGAPENEDLDDADVDERIDEDPEVARNRRDVPPTPENTIEARTEDGAEDEITRP